jgi:nucleotide-binding universal stress UspA family protein
VNAIKQILAGIDFSAWTPGVLKMAAELARGYQANLTVIYVESFLPPPYFTRGDLPLVQNSLQVQRLRAEEVLKETVQKVLGETSRVSVRLVEGLPVDGILQTADVIKADLIVMGTHGRSGVNRVLMGSVAENVLRHSKVPVLTVRGHEDRAGEGLRLPFCKILCPVNFTQLAQSTLTQSVDLAQKFGASLVVMASYEEGEKGDLKSFEDRLCAWVPGLVSCNFSPVVRTGNAAEQILKTAREEGVDLIVLGAQHKPFLEATILGTTSIRVMRHAQCPVMTVFHHLN